jgi:peptide/nickel transport system substrate-binding protein
LRLLFQRPLQASKHFDHVAILSARSPRKEAAVLGPFHLEEHRSGLHVLLRRNPYYWKKDGAGRSLPYLDAVRLEVQQNRDRIFRSILHHRLNVRWM